MNRLAGRLGAAFFMLGILALPAQAQAPATPQNRAALQANVNNSFPTNQVGAITAAQLRAFLDTFIASITAIFQDSNVISNATLAQAPGSTVKANIGGATANLADVPLSSFFGAAPDGSIPVTALTGGGNLTVDLDGFTPTPAYSQIGVTQTTGRFALPAGTTVIVYNIGANPAYVALGVGTVTATTSSDAVQPGSWIAYAVGANNQIAAIADTGKTTTLNLSGGTGTPSGSGGGSSGGGGGSAVSQGAVTTVAPTYTTGTNQSLSLDTSGNLRVTGSFSLGGFATTSAPTYAPNTTNALSLDTSGNLRVSGVTSTGVAQGSVTSGQTGGLTQGAVTTGAPSYTTAQTSPLSLDTAGNLRVTGGGVAQGSVTSGQSGSLTLGAVTTGAPTYTTAQTSPLSLDTSGQLRIGAADGAIATIGTEADTPWTGTGNTTVMGALTGLYNLTAGALIPSGTPTPGTTPSVGTLALCYNGSTPTVSATQSVALQCNATGQLVTTAGNVAQNAAISGLTGPMMQAEYLAAPPTYTTGHVAPLLTDITGNLMVNVAAGSAANAAASATGSAVPASADYQGLHIGANLVGRTGATVGSVSAGDTNLALVNGAAVAVGHGVAATAQRVELPSDGTGQVAISQGTPGTTNGVSPVLTQSGGWTPLRLAALTNTATAIDASPGQLGMLYCFNSNTSPVYAQVYNTASGGVTVGSTAAVQVYGISAGGNGGYPMSFPGVQYSTAISIAVTTTATGAGAPAIPVDCSAAYN